MSRRKKRDGPAANRAARKNGHQASASGSKPTPTPCPGSPFEDRYVALADKALATGQPVADSAVIAIPDVVLAEGHASGLPVVPTIVAQRADGRSVSFYRLPPGRSS